MKAGRTLQQLAAEVERQAGAKRDFIAPTPHLAMRLAEVPVIAAGAAAPGEIPARLEPQIMVATDSGTFGFGINDNAHSQIAARLREQLRADRFSATYNALRAQHPDLLVPLVNGLWERHPERRMVRTLDGTARAFLSDRYRVIDNDQVLESALQALQSSGAQLEIQSSEVTERRLYLKVTFPKIRREVVRGKGDVVEAGVVISNSEIGGGAVSVQPLIYRLVCLNGMIAGERLARYHVGAGQGELMGEIDFQADTKVAENRAFLLRLRDAITQAMSEPGFNRIVDRFAISTNLRIEAKPTKAVEVVAEQFGLNGDEQESILAHLIRGNDLSQWGMANAVTRFSQDVADYDRATELEAMGGRVIEMKAEDWTAVAAAGLEPGARETIGGDVRRLLAAAA